MKKTRFIGLFLAMILIFTSIVPATAFAVQDDAIIEDNYTASAPYMLRTECTDEINNEIRLWLELSPAVAESIAAFSVSLLVVNKDSMAVRGRNADFTFDASLDEAEIKESRFDSESQTLDLYVAGTKNLVKTESKETIDSQGNKIVVLTNTLELGTVRVEKLFDKENRAFKIILNGRVGELMTVGLDGEIRDAEKTVSDEFAIPVDGTIYNVAKEYTVSTNVSGKGEANLVALDGNKEVPVVGNTVEENTTVRVNAVAADGYKLESITVVDKNGKSTDITNSKKFVVNSDNTVKVVFTKVEVVAKKYTVNTEVIGNGEVKLIALAGNKEVPVVGNTVEENTTVRVNVAAADGYKLESITVVDKNGNSTDITSSEQFVVSGDKTVKVVFVKVDDGHNDNNCSCMCHKGGFMGLIYKLARAFWKLFRTHKTCECGVAHY